MLQREGLATGFGWENFFFEKKKREGGMLLMTFFLRFISYAHLFDQPGMLTTHVEHYCGFAVLR